MVQSTASTVKAYLQELEPEKRAVIKKVRKCIRGNLPKGFVEVMNWGMISYEVPLKRFPDTYNKKPLMYCALAAQKHHFAVYLMTVYAGSNYLKLLQKGHIDKGIKLNMGKCCVRFKDLDGIHLPTIGKVIAACSVDEFIDLHNTAHRNKRKRKA
ncbi:MAG: DUF1801 domain-containing protein [Gammaproteobacteria bacterium]|nr:DUF1801 domain-containing protein [Gammaproteobacteria bacterium]